MSHGYLDLTSDPHVTSAAPVGHFANNVQQGDSSEKKRYLGIKFVCCGVYARIYANKDNTAYEGRCPKCLKPVKVKIGQGGTNNRFFEAQ